MVNGDISKAVLRKPEGNTHLEDMDIDGCKL
jgi:hypothetical protein